MKNPIFVHGSTSAIQRLIEKNKIKYPSYIWNTDKHTYQFLNKNNELEEIGVPQLIGNLDNQIILSDLNDGVWRIQGQHKITENDETVFLSASDIFVIISTIDDVTRIKRITADEITTYMVYNNEIINVDSIITTKYLIEHGYITETTLDSKLIVVEDSIKTDLKQYIDDSVQDLIDEAINKGIDHYSEEDIVQLFR